jgi:hypothetical protein
VAEESGRERPGGEPGGAARLSTAEAVNGNGFAAREPLVVVRVEDAIDPRLARRRAWCTRARRNRAGRRQRWCSCWWAMPASPPEMRRAAGSPPSSADDGSSHCHQPRTRAAPETGGPTRAGRLTRRIRTLSKRRTYHVQAVVQTSKHMFRCTERSILGADHCVTRGRQLCLISLTARPRRLRRDSVS